MAMLMSKHMVLRWRCICWVLEAMDVRDLTNQEVVMLYEEASDVIDCVGIDCLPCMYVILKKLLATYLRVQGVVTVGENGPKKASKVYQDMSILLKKCYDSICDFELTKKRFR